MGKGLVLIVFRFFRFWTNETIHLSKKHVQTLDSMMSCSCFRRVVVQRACALRRPISDPIGRVTFKINAHAVVEQHNSVYFSQRCSSPGVNAITVSGVSVGYR